MMAQVEPVVFVIPPNNALKCPLHAGVLNDPVVTPCGCTFCSSCISQLLSTKQECPIHGTPIGRDQLRPNHNAQVILDDLLIHCKWGLQQASSGEWVPSPSGCKLWISIGRRREHEDICPHGKKSAFTEKLFPPPPKTCQYREHGCVFVGHTDQAVSVHEEQCGYKKLLQQIQELQSQMSVKDAEIARLTNLQDEKESAAKMSLPNVTQILESVSRGLERLDEDSTRLFEDAKNTLKRTKTAFVSSAAYQSSKQVLNSIKEVVETARAEFVAKLEEIEAAAKYKLRTLTHKRIAQPVAVLADVPFTYADYTGDDVSKGEPVSSPPASPDRHNDAHSDDETACSLSNNNSAEYQASSHADDDDFEGILEASKREYLREQALRMAEDESVRQALRLSILEVQK